jgi:predicted lysophospholipase L1 biosynthesis ABC-type transport system permease subunit
VNEAFVRRYLAGRDPLSARVSEGGAWRTVVGVVADVRHRSLDAGARPEVLLPYTQLPDPFLTAWARGLTFVIRTDGVMAAAASVVRQKVRELDASMPVITLQPMEALVSDALAQPRLRTTLLVVFALLAAALAGVGIFGLLSYVVSERTREIGVRMAIGAAPGRIFREVLTDGAKLVLVGGLIGAAAGALLTRWIGGLLFGVSPTDPVALGAAACALCTVGFIASALPARRATRVDPIVALRS